MNPKAFINNFIIIIFSTLLSMLSVSCHKEGTGGKSGVSGLVKHHEKPISNAIVYLKYGATEFPGIDVTAYDNHTAADANAHYEFKNLRKGNYYLYSTGWDNAIMQNVSGGLAIKLKYNKTITTDVAVVE